MSNADPLAEYRSGSLEPWTADVLATIVAALRPSTLLETGTFEGRTTRRLFNVMETFVHTSVLWTVEMDPERYAKVSPPEHWMTQHPSASVMFIPGDALEFLKGRPAEWADFIFLDDDHTADHVALELREAMRVLRPGGVCCVHDVIGPFGLSPVVTAMGGVNLPFVRLHAAGGLGVLTK